MTNSKYPCMHNWKQKNEPFAWLQLCVYFGIFLSFSTGSAEQVKRKLISSKKNFAYELSQELWGDLRLTKLGKIMKTLKLRGDTV